MTGPGRNVLVIDDDVFFGQVIKEYFADRDLTVHTAHTAKEGISLCASQPFDVVLLDQSLPDGSGELVCKKIRSFDELTKIVLVTAYPSFPMAVRFAKLGAYDYLPKPVDMEELDLIVSHAVEAVALERQKRNIKHQRRRSGDHRPAVATAAAWLGVEELIQLAIHSDAPVLITGETGTGKSLVARRIAWAQEGGNGKFFEVNSAALPEGLVEAELFGYEKGAFTGAVSAQAGLFELADGGTLFLDEIGELPLHIQAKLLGVLDSGTVRRVGGRTYRQIRTRIISATNIDIDKSVQQGHFRKDLLFRLAVIRIHLPPLRDRLEDLDALCTRFIDQFVGGSSCRLGPGELDRLRDYSWPGNIRELRNVIELATLVRKGAEIWPSQYLSPKEDKRDKSQLHATPGPQKQEDDQDETVLLTLEELKRRHIAAILKYTNNNITKAARILGISRSTLQRHVRRKQP